MAEFTRSKTFNNELTDRHPEASIAFEKVVISIFRQWTALELAVAQAWGGIDSQRKADALIDEVLQLFNTKRVYKDDIQLLLEEIMGKFYILFIYFHN